MGSATTQALAASTEALAGVRDVDLTVAGEFFAASGLIGDSAQLSGALADPSAPVAAREKVVETIFSGAAPAVRQVLVTVVTHRWSNADDLVDGIEELGIRAASIAAPETDLEGELFSFSRVIAANPELELALGSRLGDAAARTALVEKLLDGAASPATTLVVSALVRRPRDRRIRQLLARAIRIVSAERGRLVATVHTATALSEAQRTRLGDALAQRYDRKISLNEVIDPTVVGGLRVQVADDVIDGSISARLADLRQKLAG